MAEIRHFEPETFRACDSIGYLLKLALGSLVDRASAAFEGSDVSFMQWIALLRVHEGASRTAGDLCRAMRYDTGAVTRLLDQLETRGLLTRERSREDRRVVALQTTEAGAEMVARLKPMFVDELNHVVATFSADELAELLRLLHKLIDRVQLLNQEDGKAS
jgi:DNA-binding MarR family transcriptional regulator